MRFFRSGWFDRLLIMEINITAEKRLNFMSCPCASPKTFRKIEDRVRRSCAIVPWVLYKWRALSKSIDVKIIRARQRTIRRHNVRSISTSDKRAQEKKNKRYEISLLNFFFKFLSLQIIFLKFWLINVRQKVLHDSRIFCFLSKVYGCN